MANKQKPNKQEVTEFWKRVWSEPKMHNKNATRSKAEEENIILTLQELAEIIRHTHNWKCPGTDNIQNFWYKQFNSIYEALTCQIIKNLVQPHTPPKFLKQGITHIRPKYSDTKNTAKKRPNICLPILYNIITATISKIREKHLTQNKIFTEEQKWCRK